MKEEKINKIAKKIMASYIQSYYYFTNVGKELNVCMKLHNLYGINACIGILKNMKDELNSIEKELSNYGMVKKKEYILPDNGFEQGYVFIKKDDDVSDDAIIDYLQNIGFQHKE